MTNVVAREKSQDSYDPTNSECITSPEARLSNLPPFPASATKLLKLLQTQDADVRAVKDIFVSDQSLAADVIRLANSPLFTVTNSIRSVEHAVALLGLDRVKALAISVAMCRYSAGVHDSVSRRCWEHSLACAVVSEELADFYTVTKEDAHTAGLLHDIGRIGLLKAYSKEYLPVLKADYQVFAETLEMERYLMRTDHCQSGAFLSKVWAFPRSLQIVAECHHSEPELNEPQVAILTRAACALTDALGEMTYAKRPGVEDALVLLCAGAVDRFMMRLSGLMERIEEKIAYFRAS